MTKTELINSIADKANCTKKDASAALEATLSAIQETLESGEKVCINPRTKEQMTCPPCKAPAFKAGRTLKEAINK